MNNELLLYALLFALFITGAVIILLLHWLLKFIGDRQQMPFEKELE